MRLILMAFVGYSLCWWGATMLVGGPGGTGSWSLMYALFKLGDAPPTAPTKKGSQEGSSTAAGAPFTVPATNQGAGGDF